jgi:hypothetical protein
LKKLSLLLIAVLAISTPFSMGAQANTIASTTVRILAHDGTAITGARVSLIGLPQAPQLSTDTGATQWNVASGATYSFNVQYRPSESKFLSTNSFEVRLFVSSQTSEQILKLPKLLTVKFPLKDATNYGSNLLQIQWKRSFQPSVEINGVPQQPDFGFRLPSTLEITDTANGKVATLQYFQPAKLRKAAESDVDNDLIPDNEFAVASTFGSINYVIPSGSVESNPPSLSLNQSHWVRAVPDNEGVTLSLMLGDKDVTANFPEGVFRAQEVGPDLGSVWAGSTNGLSVSGSRATYQWGSNGSLQDFVFSFQINQISLGFSSVMNLQIKSAICWDNSKGSIKQFRTLGTCPNGWVSTATVRKLSEKKYLSCAALNKILVGGVGRSSATNFGKRAFKGWLSHDAGYLKNKHLDTDKDGIACEK